MCIMSDNTLYSLFKSLFFHTIFKKQVNKSVLPFNFENSIAVIMTNHFSISSKLPRLCIIFQKITQLN